MTKPVVQLWALEGDPYFGLIIPCSSGVWWTNQVGGTYCAHPEVEGIFIPLPVGWNPNYTPLIDVHRSYSASLVQSFLEDSPELLACFSPCSELDIREKHFSILAEAWVPVRIRDSEPPPTAPVWATTPLLAAFWGRPGILTYSNSD